MTVADLLEMLNRVDDVTFEVTLEIEDVRMTVADLLEMLNRVDDVTLEVTLEIEDGDGNLTESDLCGAYVQTLEVDLLAAGPDIKVGRVRSGRRVSLYGDAS